MHLVVCAWCPVAICVVSQGYFYVVILQFYVHLESWLFVSKFWSENDPNSVGNRSSRSNESSLKSPKWILSRLGSFSRTIGIWLKKIDRPPYWPASYWHYPTCSVLKRDEQKIKYMWSHGSWAWIKLSQRSGLHHRIQNRSFFSHGDKSTYEDYRTRIRST